MAYKAVLLCGDCGVIPLAQESQYRSMPAKGAWDHVADNPGHIVAVYSLVEVVG